MSLTCPLTSYRARTYQNGSPQMSGKLYRRGNAPNAFSPFYRSTKEETNVDWYLACNYTCNLHAWGGFAPQGWTVPYSSQYEKMIQDLSDIQGQKPNGTLGASFLRGGIYGLNTQATGFVVIGYDSGKRDVPERVAIVNEKILYLGALSDDDREKLEGSNATYSKWGDLESMMSCPALAVDPANGTVAMTYYGAQLPVHLSDTEFADNGYFPEDIRGKGAWNNYANLINPVAYLNRVFEMGEPYKYDWCGNHLCYPVIICQQVAK